MSVINFDPVVFGVPKPVPPPPPVKWASGDHTWTVGTGDQAKTWDISGGSQGIMLTAGVRGLGMPEFTRYKDESPAVSGSTYRGYIAVEREVMWPLWVFNNESSEEWLKTDRSFWDSLHPDRTGVWTYVSRDGVTRSLTCRFSSDGGKVWDFDPGTFGWQDYQLYLVAEDPFWRGPRISKLFGGGVTSTPFFGAEPTPGGPPFYIAAQFQIANGRVSNPGNEPAWPKWTLYGPFTEAAVGIGGKSIEVPFEVESGEWVYIDTDPKVRKAMLGTGTPSSSTGVDRFSDLGLVNWAQIPPGGDLALDMEMTGTGSIRIEIDPAYHRAF